MSSGITSTSEESQDISKKWWLDSTEYKIHYPPGDERRDEALFPHGTRIKIMDHKLNVLICAVWDEVEQTWQEGFPIHRDYVRLPSYEEKKAR